MTECNMAILSCLFEINKQVAEMYHLLNEDWSIIDQPKRRLVQKIFAIDDQLQDAKRLIESRSE